MNLAFRYCFCVLVFFGMITMLAHAINNLEAKTVCALASVVFGLLSMYFYNRESIYITEVKDETKEILT